MPWKLRYSKHGTNIIEIDIFIFYMDTTFLNSSKSSFTAVQEVTFRQKIVHLLSQKATKVKAKHHVFEALLCILNIQQTPPPPRMNNIYAPLAFASFCRKKKTEVQSCTCWMRFAIATDVLWSCEIELHCWGIWRVDGPRVRYICKPTSIHFFTYTCFFFRSLTVVSNFL